MFRHIDTLQFLTGYLVSRVTPQVFLCTQSKTVRGEAVDIDSMCTSLVELTTYRP